MIWAYVLLACWAAATGAEAQGGCYTQIASERRPENSCHRKIICERRFSYVSDLNRCGKYGTELSLNNSTEKKIKSIESLKIVNQYKYIEKFNAANNNWRIIYEDDFSFCRNARFLNISHNHIQFIRNGPFYSLTKLEFLDLSHNEIHWIERKHFSMISNNLLHRPLKTLLLAHNDITKVDDDTFADLHALRNLDLSHNKIMVLASESFHTLHYLTELRLEHNRLRIFDNYSNLINLRSINVSNNQLTRIYINTYILTLDASHNNFSTVDLDMFNKSDMPSVDMSHNNLKELRNTTSNNYEAIRWSSGYHMKLDLSFNNLAHIDYDAFLVFYNMMSLNLSHNQLHRLNINPEYLKNLTELHMQHNKFNFISSKMFKGFYNLNYLDISNNELSIGSLHRHCFASLNKLTTLKMMNNDIKIIDDTTGLMDGLTNLVELEMFNNSLYSVNFTGSSCGSLVRLSLARNNISDLKNVELDALKNIHYVDMSDNIFREIYENSFRKLYTLKHLNLSKNEISEIHPAAFFDLNQLKTLDLSNNILQTLQYGSFEGLGNLRILDLSSNRLRYVKMNAFLQLSALRMLILDDNNIVSLDHSSYRVAGGNLALSIGGNHLSCDWLSAAVSGQLPGHPSITIQSKIKDYSGQFVKGIKCIDYKLPNVEIVGNAIPIGSPLSMYTEGRPNKPTESLASVMKKQYDILENIEEYVGDIKKLMENKEEDINSNSISDDLSPFDLLSVE